MHDLSEHGDRKIIPLVKGRGWKSIRHGNQNKCDAYKNQNQESWDMLLLFGYHVLVNGYISGLRSMCIKFSDRNYRIYVLFSPVKLTVMSYSFTPLIPEKLK